MLVTRFCALETCGLEFQTDNPRKTHCSTRHSTLDRMRRHRAKNRKGGGGGGGNGGGGGIPTLFDTITPVDPASAFVPIPVIGPKERKPSQTISGDDRRAA